MKLYSYNERLDKLLLNLRKSGCQAASSLCRKASSDSQVLCVMHRGRSVRGAEALTWKSTDFPKLDDFWINKGRHTALMNINGFYKWMEDGVSWWSDRGHRNRQAGPTTFILNIRKIVIAVPRENVLRTYLAEYLSHYRHPNSGSYFQWPEYYWKQLWWLC